MNGSRWIGRVPNIHMTEPLHIFDRHKKMPTCHYCCLCQLGSIGGIGMLTHAIRRGGHYSFLLLSDTVTWQRLEEVLRKMKPHLTVTELHENFCDRISEMWVSVIKLQWQKLCDPRYIIRVIWCRTMKSCGFIILFCCFPGNRNLQTKTPDVLFCGTVCANPWKVTQVKFEFGCVSMITSKNAELTDCVMPLLMLMNGSSIQR